MQAKSSDNTTALPVEESAKSAAEYVCAAFDWFSWLSSSQRDSSTASSATEILTLFKLSSCTCFEFGSAFEAYLDRRLSTPIDLDALSCLCIHLATQFFHHWDLSVWASAFATFLNAEDVPTLWSLYEDAISKHASHLSSPVVS